jgi:Glycosyltransferase
LQEFVQLPGPKPQHELRAHLANASVFVLPSVPEPEGGMDNLPTVIMEAMATGLAGRFNQDWRDSGDGH